MSRNSCENGYSNVDLFETNCNAKYAIYNDEKFSIPWSEAQREGKACGFAADVWAAGVIFYELCIAPTDLRGEIYNILDKVDKGQRISLPRRFPKEVIYSE